MPLFQDFVEALIESVFDIFVAVVLGVFNAVLLPVLEAIPGLFGIVP